MITTIEKSQILLEDFAEQYKGINFKEKVVADVGGFIGETAILFIHWGAKKVLIYEPIQENVYYIRRNILLNKINAEVYDCGVTSEETKIELEVKSSSIGKTTFGLIPGKKK